jgi:hypothetical protein
MADAIGAFVIGRTNIDEMSRRFPWIEFGSSARAHEGGRLVDHAWRMRLEASDDISKVLMPLLQACARRPRLRGLLPFTSHEVLLFSRTTGYPFDAMLACARPVEDPSSERERYIERFAPGQYEIWFAATNPSNHRFYLAT